ncbi:regulatory protein [Caloramator quimbayensis]|uniref:Regulatory protein RecX n=1 Tax=Caloramator quimbayensis TaxID=1147123 RepID=A0A1T4XCA0_9CLOT|nr:RecX family transcriptional regulator [Caloramator quimbayensis]SKA86768.1 regulatory protein [Caloramator quimbayensis]
MIITKVIKQNNKNERYNVFIDDEYSFSASSEDILKYSIKSGLEITKEQLNSLIECCEVTKCYNYALFILGKKDYTEYEISKKISDKGYSFTSISKTIEKLKLYDIINDERYVKKYINDCIYIKKYGRKKIEYNLQKKGINPDLIKECFFDNNSDYEYENALEILQKKIKYCKDEKNIRNKLIRHLLSKGFTYDIVKKAISSLKIEDDGDLL